jgi:amidase
MKALILTNPWLHDPLVHEIPWRGEKEKFSKLTFGVINDDGVVRPNPPVSSRTFIVSFH